MSVLGGISNAAILTAINAGAWQRTPVTAACGRRRCSWLRCFLFFKTQVYVSTRSPPKSKRSFTSFAYACMDYVRRSELLAIEEIGRARIIAAITSDSAILTQASNMLSFSIQGPVLIGFVAIYVAYLSFVAFALSVLIVGAAAAIFHFKSRQLTAEEAKVGGAGAAAVRSTWPTSSMASRNSGSTGRAATICSTTPLTVSRTAANIKIRSQSETFKQIASTQGYYVHPARRRRFRRSAIQRHPGRCLDRQDHRQRCSTSSGRASAWCNRSRS